MAPPPVINRFRSDGVDAGSIVLTSLCLLVAHLGCGGGTATSDARLDGPSGDVSTDVARDGAADEVTDGRPGDTTPPDGSPTETGPGDSGGASIDAPIEGSDSALRRLAAGRNHSCAIRDNGTVWCWGGETSAALRPAMLAALPAKALMVASGGDQQTCALLAGGAVWCWVDGKAPAAVAGLTAVTQLAVGEGFACAVKSEGTLWCWGKNAAGQLGDGTTTDRVAPVAVMGATDAVEVGAGLSHACLRRKDGTVWCWGDNSFWQLGDGSTIGRYAPVAVNGVPAGTVQLAIGPRHSCARTVEGTVWCWGFNGSGESSSSGTAFVQPPKVFEALGPASEVRAGGYYALGGYDHAATCSRKMDGSVWCVGRNVNGELGDGTLGTDATDSPVRVSNGGEPLADLAIGGQHACARGLKGSDAVWCWGMNYYGQLGRETPYSAVPEKLAGFGPFTEIAVGSNSTCARTTGEYFCWGENGSGQLGAAVKSPVLAPLAVTGLPPDVKQFAVGGRYSCWLRTSGQVLCTGGKFGKTPVEVPGMGLDNVQLAVGNGHACTVKRDGTLWCWGNTICGVTPQEFDATQQSLFIGTNVAVFAGTTSTCVQRADGTIWCCGEPWGYSPIQAPVGSDAVELALGLNGCARKADGTVLCGPGLKTVTPVNISGVVQLAVSNNAACARKADGSVSCWGTNRRGVLGVMGGDALQPIPVASLPASMVKISGGAEHFCGLDASGRAWCWGDNYRGQLGDGGGGDRPQIGLSIFP